MKDTLVVTAKSSGAEVIPFIKVWVMFPGSLLLTYLFTRLSNRLKWEYVFYSMLGLFLVYFTVFTFFVYPIRDSLHPNAAADYLQSVLPLGLKGMVTMFRNWTLTSFYVMSELFSNIVLSLLFWGFANQVTRLSEAKRFYAIFGIGGNITGILAGQISVYLSRADYFAWLPLGSDKWEQTMMILVSIVIINGVAALALFRWLNVNVLSDPRFYNSEDAKDEKNIKGKMSFMENITIILRSKYLMRVAIIMIAYNISINLVEVLWKDQMKELYPTKIEYNIYFNQVSTIVGIIATLSALLLSGNSIRKFGWTFTALITPFAILITSIGFFGAYFFKGQLDAMGFTLLGMGPLALVVFFGSLQNIVCRAAKYTVFDTTKEMSLLPLNATSKIKAKASIDGVCNRLGKSGGSVMYQGLFVMFSTIGASSPYVAGILVVVLGIWVRNTQILGNEFNQISSQSGKIDLDAENELSELESEPLLAE